MATKIGDNTDKLNIFNEIRKRIEGKFDCIIQKATERRDTLLEQLTEWEREYRVVIEGLEELKSSKQEMEQLYSTLKSETARKSLEKSIDELSERIRDSDNQSLDLSFVCETNDFEWRISQLGVLTQDIFVEAYSSNENSSQSTMLKPDPDYSTGQKMKLFQFKSSSQPQGPFNPSTGGVTPVQSNSQPENIDTPIFRTSQVPVMNLFAPQAKPVPSLFPSQTQQQQQREPSLQQQIPSYQFGPQPAIFKQEPANPLSNVFKQTNVFSPTPNTGFPFSATGTTPHTPSTGFPFPPATQLPTQQITPTTPQTPTYGGFNMGASKPSSDVARPVVKTARRRLPHNK
eukprot:TRINITY_DN278_c0_g1_i7.p1 TRINITY_DN278_c0_g1~~TRINITY_DN278_c0_g1_i7.p1  ORF type:complete len:358 (-),score=92.19 TRINITY_DN278_c0_g1_i7:1045-2076(-)